jgi:multidrug efflux pump subunit AcrB
MLSAILTTCAVFIPLVSINGLAGALFRDQALAVAIVLFTSWLVTITAVPVYYFCWYRRQTAFRPHPLLERIAFTQALERWDGRVNSWMLRHRGVAWALVGLSAIGAVLGFLFIPKATLPHLTRTDTLLRIDWNESLSPEELRYLVSVTDDALAHCDHLLRHSTTILRSLTQGELAVLLYINEHREDATAVSIANAVGLTRPRITQIVNALEEKDYAHRQPDPHDGRKMHVVISPPASAP